MNLSGLIFWSTTVVAGLAGAYNIEDIQKTVWRAQAKILYESRTETWGSPRFLRMPSEAPERRGFGDRSGK